MKSRSFFASPDGIKRERKPIFAAPVTGWVIGAFALSTVIVGLILFGLSRLGYSEKTVDPDVYNAVGAVGIYVLLVTITLGLPRLLKLWSARYSFRKLLGLDRLLQWKDIGVVLFGYVVYLALGIGLTILISSIAPGFNATQAQDLGCSKSLNPSDMMIIFLILVVVAPVAEEVIFRGYLFGTLRRTAPVWVAILITSLVFGALHLGTDVKALQWNVAVDVFALSIVSCMMRLKTGSLWPSMLLHMTKNGIAFYMVYLHVASTAMM